MSFINMECPRLGDWKLIRHPQIDKTLLFNRKSDPHEMEDLAAAPQQTDRGKQMMVLLA